MADAAEGSGSKIIRTYQTDLLTFTDFKTQQTSDEKRLIHNQQSLIHSPQDLTTDEKLLLENQNGWTGNGPSLFLTNPPTQRLRLETKELHENKREHNGAGENLDTVLGASSLDFYSDLDGKQRSLSATQSVAGYSQFGNVEPTKPFMVDDAVCHASEDVETSCDPARDFDEISAQMRSLTETVDHLERVLIAYSCNQTHKTSPVNQPSSSELPLNPHHVRPPVSAATEAEAANWTSDAQHQRTSRTSDDAAQGCGSAAETGSASVDVAHGCLVALNYTQVNEEQLIVESVDDIPCNAVILPDAPSSAVHLTPDETDWFGEAAVADEDSPPTASPCGLQVRSQPQ